MRPLAVKRDANAVPGGKDWANLCADLSRWISEHMLREGDIRFGNTVAESAVDHCFRATRDLFRRLEQRDKRPTPRLRCSRDQFRRAQQTRHMCIMATSMCDAHFISRVINCVDR